MGSGTGQRPLSEVSPMAQRRNSPVWNQSSRMMKTSDSSPYESTSSTRLFWQGRDSGSPFQRNSENQAPYDPEAPLSPSKRPSIENLKRASRVKNSNMFRDQNQEYDPAHVYVPQRPLVTNRSSPQRQSQGAPTPRSAQNTDSGGIGPRPPSPSKDQVPPAKSSLSRASRFGFKNSEFDPENEIWSDIDGTRYTKSVTFDAAPPQVNEYEMTTPDPSSVASESRDGSYDSEEDEYDISFDRESLDRDDSFDASLEDLEKTPVVLPEDWRYMNTHGASAELEKEDEDHFASDASHSPDPRPPSRQESQTKHSRVESLDSNGERRPLPPLPPINRLSFSPRASSPEKLAAAFELGSGSQRGLPSPPAPAAYSKADIAKLGQSSMSLEDRLRLMMINESGQENAKAEREVLEEPGLNLSKIRKESAQTDTDEKDTLDIQSLDKGVRDESDVFAPPRISRDSILRDLRKNDGFGDDDYDLSSQESSSPKHYLDYDPDIPIPSLELDDDHDYEDDDDTNSVVIKPDPDDDHNDLYDIPNFYDAISSQNSSFGDLKGKDIDDDESQYSSHSMEEDFSKSSSSFVSEATPVPGERAETFNIQPSSNNESDHKDEGVVLPKIPSISGSLHRPVTPENQADVSPPSTPDSVIRHQIDSDVSDLDVSADEAVPEPVATVKAPGTGLKTRPSLTPADIESMAATRRKISGQHPPSVALPACDAAKSEDPEDPAPEDEEKPQLNPPKEPQRQCSLVKLDIPFSIQEEDSLGLGLDKEFDRVIESQKRGYLMRQNTKVIVASSRPDDDPVPTPTAGEPGTEVRGTKVAAPSPRKASQQTWTTVPWNGQTRRASIRTSSSAIRKKPLNGPVPPLPGQQSNAQEVPTTVEEPDPATAFEDGEERGRLFVKVVGMKYLDLPLPKGERSYFALTLDNGLHCVTTAWLELGKTAPIGQEFELIVQNDLEFQLTLQMKVDEEKFRVQEPAPSGSPSRQKQSTFSRVFASPRKRKELDMKQQLASQQQKKQDVNAPVWERLRTLIARDGSFARAYVALSDHEKHCFGRPFTVDVACFNEWAVDETPSSVKSKKSTSSAISQRRPPYKIGKLELQLLFVPKPKGAKDDDMPKSMNACVREMREAENFSTRSWEGFLSQQGGDCPFWRRRFFKLQGSKLTAYHETTRQPRATINLSKASKLIDDRSALTQKETTTRGGKRRKSAFAEEEEGYMFVEEGFRIRFGNGEVIDFYADSAADKEGWMKVLAETVGKGQTGGGQVKPWTEMVLKRERSMKSTSRRQTTDRLSNVANIVNAPPPPIRKDGEVALKTAPAPAPTATATTTTTTAPATASTSRPRHKHTQSQPEVRSAEARRQKARSLIF